MYTLSLKDWKTKEQITNSEHSEIAARFDVNGNIVYTRKQNDAERISLFILEMPIPLV